MARVQCDKLSVLSLFFLNLLRRFHTLAENILALKGIYIRTAFADLTGFFHVELNEIPQQNNADRHLFEIKKERNLSP